MKYIADVLLKDVTKQFKKLRLVPSADLHAGNLVLLLESGGTVDKYIPPPLSHTLQ